VLLLTLTFSSASFAACLADSPEIGDIGPGSQLVCSVLVSRFPDSDITILDRKIESHNVISVIIAVDDQSNSLEYKLKGADWELTEPVLAGSYRTGIE